MLLAVYGEKPFIGCSKGQEAEDPLDLFRGGVSGNLVKNPHQRGGKEERKKFLLVDTGVENRGDGAVEHGMEGADRVVPIDDGEHLEADEGDVLHGGDPLPGDTDLPVGLGLSLLGGENPHQRGEEPLEIDVRGVFDSPVVGVSEEVVGLVGVDRAVKNTTDHLPTRLSG